jgi:outer membrane protein assembly factor BamB
MSNGKVLWKHYIGPGLWYNYYDNPIIANGVIYVVDYDETRPMIHAIGAKNGTVLWTYFSNEFIWGSLTIADGVMYFGTYHGPVYAVNAITGKKIWEAGIDPEIAFGYPTSVESSPLVDGNYVYFQDWYGWIYKFNKANGARAAKIETGNRYNLVSEGITYQLKAGHFGSPALSNGILYSGCRDINFVWMWPESFMREDYVCAVTTSGTPVWKSTNGLDWGHWYTYSTPAVAGNRVYMSSGNGNITAFNKDTGSRLWNFVGGWYTFGEPVIANETVYVASVVREPDEKYFGRMYALNAANGAKIWSMDVEDQKAWWNNAPVYANNVLYASYSWADSTKPPYPKESGKLFAINTLTGQQIWNYSYDDWIGSPTVADGVVYFESEDGYLFALGNATADTLPVPDFSADATIGVSPMTVHFTDLSRSNGTLYRNWSFGDGNWTNSTGLAPVNPTFTYHTPGYYWVELSVTNSSGTNTTTRSNYIHVLDEPFTFTGPEITKINVTPKAPTTLHNVKFKAEYRMVEGYEIVGYDWNVLDAATGKTDWSLSKNENPVIYKPAAGRYKNKVVQCTMTYREIDTGQLGFSYASQPFKVYFEMGNATTWADDDRNDKPNWYEYWKKDQTIDGIENFGYTLYPEAGEYDGNNNTLMFGPQAPTT